MDYTHKISALHGKYNPPQKTLKYGTAGFRDRADLPLHSTCARMGLMAALRSGASSRSSKDATTAQCVGVMITASHNAEPDNGIKIVDVNGGMLDQDLEPFAMQFANARECDEMLQHIRELMTFLKGEYDTQGGAVMVGWDTRPHSPELMRCVVEGIEACGGTALLLGEVTTPQLHFAVHDMNTTQWCTAAAFEPEAALQRYYNTLTSGYVDLMRSTANSNDDSKNDEDAVPEVSVVVDASFGVGSLALVQMERALASHGTRLKLDIRNAARAGPVNEGCGAELVQKGQVPPCGVDAGRDCGKIMCSFDGDADRIVFHTFPSSGEGSSEWALLDGDRIAAVFASFIRQELEAAQLLDRFRLGCVQTAYANGGSGGYLLSQGVPVTMAKTGVKYLHHAALGFDLGVYFEANGHGTVLFSETFLSYVNSLPTEQLQGSTRSALALRRLVAFTRVINQAVGDAISDMLATIALLHIAGLDLVGWKALYTELPSRQLKVPHARKALIQCSDDETRALEPSTLQPLLDTAMAAQPCGRCFVRPSGTEDVVRVYAEAATQAQANELADQCIAAINAALGN
jgi:phosphoacetylglucosamine mutase